MAAGFGRRNFLGASAFAAITATGTHALAGNCPDRPESSEARNRWKMALNPIQWMATPDGWIDPRLLPPLGELLNLVKSAGFNAVPVAVPGDISAQEFRSALAQADLEAAPGYLSIRLPEEGRSQKTTLELVKQAAEQHVVCGQDRMFVSMSQLKSAPRVAVPAQGVAFDLARLERIAKLMDQIAHVLVAEGVRPALHQHVGGWIETESEVRQVLDYVSPAILDFGPDVGHLYWAGVDPAMIIRDYHDRVAGVHIKDVRGAIARSSHQGTGTYQDAVKSGIWIEPGRGDLDLAAVFKALGEDFSGWLVVENDRADLPVWESAVFSSAWMNMNLPSRAQLPDE